MGLLAVVSHRVGGLLLVFDPFAELEWHFQNFMGGPTCYMI